MEFWGKCVSAREILLLTRSSAEDAFIYASKLFNYPSHKQLTGV